MSVLPENVFYHVSRILKIAAEAAWLSLRTEQTAAVAVQHVIQAKYVLIVLVNLVVSRVFPIAIICVSTCRLIVRIAVIVIWNAVQAKSVCQENVIQIVRMDLQNVMESVPISVLTLIIAENATRAAPILTMLRQSVLTVPATPFATTVSVIVTIIALTAVKHSCRKTTKTAVYVEMTVVI